MDYVFFLQVFVALLSACLTLQHVVAVVNNGQNTKNEESLTTVAETKESDKTNGNAGDLVAESSETSNRREASSILDSYGVPSLTSGSGASVNLPIPVYGVPNAQSNNVVYPGPPPDIPPPPPKISPASLYGPPKLGNVYGVPQLPPISKGYGAPLNIKYGAPSYPLNQFSVNLSPPKPIYGPPKGVYGPPVKPLKYHKYPPKNFNFRPPKPVYGAPIISGFKDNFNYNKIKSNNYLNTKNFNNIFASNVLNNNAFSTNSISNLYSGISSLNHQYGAPILPPKVQFGAHNVGISTQYGVPEKVIESGPSLSAYGPPQPSPNPKPPHPGAPAPPTPPDIKYDGWQPIPGLVSKRPEEEIHHITGEGSGYHDLSPPPLGNGHNQLSNSYGAPAVTLDVTHGNGLSDSYGVSLNAIAGSKGVSDSYSAPLGTVTGSGGIVASSGDEAHHAGSHSSSHSNSHGLNLDLSSVGGAHNSDIQAVKSVEYNISPQNNAHQISDVYGVPQADAFSSAHSYNSLEAASQSYKGSFNSHSHTSSHFANSDIGLIPPSGVYGAPPSNQYGTPLYTNSNYKTSSRPGFYPDTGKGHSYLPPVQPLKSYGVPSGSTAISFQNVAHGSATAGIDLQHTGLNIEGASALPLTSYNVPLGSIDGNYALPESNGDISVSLDFSHPPVTIDLTDGKQDRDCYNKQQLQVPSLAYGVPSADSYTSSLSSLTTNIATSHTQSIVPQSSYGALDLVPPQAQISVPSSQYGVPDLAHSASVKTEAKVNSVAESEEAHGKNYGKSVAASFGPNSELVESQSLDLNNIPIQGNLGSYTLQIQSADGAPGQVPHTQVLNEGLLQSILQAIEQPGKQGQNTKYPIVLQPSVERNNYSINETISNLDGSSPQASEISEVVVEAPKDSNLGDKSDNVDSEESLQVLDTSNIALYYKKDDDSKKVDVEEKADENSVDNESN